MNTKEKLEYDARKLADFLINGFNRKIKLEKLQEKIKQKDGK